MWLSIFSNLAKIVSWKFAKFHTMIRIFIKLHENILFFVKSFRYFVIIYIYHIIKARTGNTTVVKGIFPQIYFCLKLLKPVSGFIWHIELFQAISGFFWQSMTFSGHLNSNFFLFHFIPCLKHGTMFLHNLCWYLTNSKDTNVSSWTNWPPFLISESCIVWTSFVSIEYSRNKIVLKW